MSDPNDALRVLIVDDEPLIAELLQSALEDAGFSAVQAADVEAAFAFLDAEGSQLVGVVTDINLGSAKDGWDVGRRAREQNAQVAIVYCSGFGVHEWPTKGVPNSVVLTKPFAPAQVVVALAHQINAASPGAAGA